MGVLSIYTDPSSILSEPNKKASHLLQLDRSMAQVLENTPIINKDHRSLSRCCNLKNPSTTKALAKAIAQAQSRSTTINCGDNSNNKGRDHGRVQIKFVISKRELKQMVRSIGSERSGDNHRPAAAGLEELLQALRKKHNKRAELVSRRWQPKLQSIPEEL